jgi:hypothetical protein
MARRRSRGTTAPPRALAKNAAGAEPVEVTIEHDRTRYRATFRGVFAGALLDQVTATVIVWRELDWCGTWAWIDDTIARRIDGKRTVRREALDAIAAELRAELVRRGALEQPKGADAGVGGDDQADADDVALAIPSKADPRRVPCPECHAIAGATCKNYKGSGCAPHRFRVKAAREAHDKAIAERADRERLAGELAAVRRKAAELVTGRCPDCAAPLPAEGSRCDRCGWVDFDGDHKPSPRTPDLVKRAIADREGAPEHAAAALVECPMAWADVCALAAPLTITPHEGGAQSPAKVWSAVQRLRGLARLARDRLFTVASATRDELHRDLADGGTETVDIAIAYLLREGEMRIVTRGVMRRGNDVLTLAPEGVRTATMKKPEPAKPEAPKALPSSPRAPDGEQAPEAPAAPPSSPERSGNGSGKASKLKPTREQFAAYRGAFRHFNKELFEGQLPEVILNFSRHAKSLGFFSPNRWVTQDGETTAHEITLNPDHLLDRTARETASTLVHELCHLWRHLNGGKPPRKGYHDRPWAQKMKDVGLQPSSTGQPGGAEVGVKMTHYIVDGGPFDRAFSSLTDAHLLPWRSSAHARNGKPCPNGGEGDGDPPPLKKQDPSKCKYTCPGCGANVWGKGGLRIDCRTCEVAFAEV